MTGFKYYRIRRRLSQKALAERSGCAAVTVCMVENGSQHALGSTCARMAAGLDIPLREALRRFPDTALAGHNARKPSESLDLQNPLTAYMLEKHLSYRALAVLLGSNRTTVMTACRARDCREDFLERLAAHEHLSPERFREAYGEVRRGA